MTQHDADAVAFPRLDEAQLAILDRCPLTKWGRREDGESLFELGDRDFKFFVVKLGRVEIMDESGDAPKTVAVLGPGEFTGDEAQVTGGPAVVGAVTRGDTEVYEVTNDALRLILNLHPDLGDVFMRAFLARRQYLRESNPAMGPSVIGSRHSQETFRLRDFLARNRMPFTWLDPEADPGTKQRLARCGLREPDLPAVVWGRKLCLSKPTIRELAEALGLCRTIDRKSYDLVVVGAGPAGLAAAVYGASEGLSTLVLERIGPGGQAGRSMRIENYLGFPTGITGGELAERAVAQAHKFGADLPIPTPVVGMTFDDGCPVVHLEDGEAVKARCLLIATGADYRRLGVEGCERFEGRGVYYAATMNEASMCRGSEVAVVGGGNSAGQAVVFLSGQVRKVYLLIRGDNLAKDMSDYLARRIEQTPNVEILCNTEVREMSGDDYLSAVDVANDRTGEDRTLRVAALFSFIGAVPRTEWLPPEIERDGKGFVRTGPDLAASAHRDSKRPPFLLETSHPGIFAAGDVRSGSIKRVASAVGEGAMAVQFVHQYMKEH